MMDNRLMTRMKPALSDKAWRPVVGMCLLVIAALLAVACDGNEDGIRVYEVAKSTEHHGSAFLSSGPEQTMPGQQSAASPLDLVQWTMPEAWHQEHVNRPMILAVFHADASHSLEIQVSAISGDAGGVLANVNRWRKQLELGPITDEQLVENVEIINTQGSFGGVVDVTNKEAGKRTIATVIQGGAGMSWFVKASGEPDAVGKQKKDIIAFTESFRFKPADAAEHQHNHAERAHDQVAPTTQSTGSPDMSMQGPLPAGAIPSGGLTIAKPDSWTSMPTSSPVIHSAFTAKSTQGEAQITITSLNNDGGGLLPNINRWRGQLGLAPVASLSDQPVGLLNMTGVTAMLIDLEAQPDGEHAGKRVLMAVVSRPTDTWYFKMTGSTPALTQLKTDFINAVQSARFAGAGQ